MRAKRLASLLFAAAVPITGAAATSFSDVTSQAGLAGIRGFRCSVGDINGDGYPDLLLHRQSIYETGDVLNKQHVYLNVPGASPGSRGYQDFTSLNQKQ